MNGISIIYADDGKKWGEFLSKEVENLGKVYQHMLNRSNTLQLTGINQNVNCIILSPNMFHSKKRFLELSSTYVDSPIIVLCGIPQDVMNQAACCKSLKQCMIVTVTSSEESADNFYRAVEKRLIEQKISNNVTLVPDTVIEKANQSCVLMFPETVFGEVEVLIQDQPKTILAKKEDTKTYIFNIPRLTEGRYDVTIIVSNKIVPQKFTLTIIKPKTQKCSCDYICQMLDSDDFNQLDLVLTTAMENDYSNRLFYQNIFRANPDFPELPTAFHFAAKHGMAKVLKHLMKLPIAQNRKEKGLDLPNDRDMNCFDIAKDTKYSSTLIPILKGHCDDSTYMDMTQNNNYMAMTASHKRQKTNILCERQNLAYLMKG